MFNQLKTTKNKFISKIILLNFFPFFALAGAYLICYKINFSPLVIILGSIFWGFLPGYFLNHSLKIDKCFNTISKIGFSVTSSIVVINLILYLCRGSISFYAQYQVATVLLINTVLFFVYLFSVLDEKIRGNSENNAKPYFHWSILVVFLPFAFFLARSILNPFILDSDGVTYINIMKEIAKTHVDGSFIGLRRGLFTNLVMSLYYLTGLDFLVLFKFVLPGFAWLSITSIGAAFKKTKNTQFAALAALLILLSSSLVDNIDRFKPETISFILGVPTAILYALALTKKDYKFYLVGLVYSFAAFRAHDTGMILLLTCLIGGIGILNLFWDKIRPSLTFRNTLLVIIIFLPYLVIFDLFSLINNFSAVFQLLPQSWNSLHFKLWFLNNYTSGGSQVGWPGWTFVLFYMYNGIYALLLLILLAFAVVKKTTKLKKSVFLMVLPSVVSLSLFLLVAEILPRFGLFFLPDRAWNHVFYDSALIILVIINFVPEIISNLTRKVSWIFFSMTTFFLVISVIISTLMPTLAGSVASRSETAAIQTMRQNIEKNSVILSTQRFNKIMVTTYARKKFVYIDPAIVLVPENSNKIDITAFKNSLSAAIEKDTIKLLPEGYEIRDTTEITSTTTITNDGSTTYSTQAAKNNKSETVSIGQEEIGASVPVYFLYSFSKTDGLMAKLGRKYWTEGLDINHKELFENTGDSETFFKDKSVVLIKIQ